MKHAQFTTDDYLQAIRREESKRATAYPKIMEKMKKRDATPEERQEVYLEQEQQIRWLKYASVLVMQYPQRTVLDGAFRNEILAELARELKMRRKHYPRWVNFYKKMNQETADYELAVWESLTRWFAKEYLDLDELPTKRKKKQ